MNDPTQAWVPYALPRLKLMVFTALGYQYDANIPGMSHTTEFAIPDAHLNDPVESLYDRYFERAMTALIQDIQAAGRRQVVHIHMGVRYSIQCQAHVVGLSAVSYA